MTLITLKLKDDIKLPVLKKRLGLESEIKPVYFGKKNMSVDGT